ncbi:hypothetical protein K504DRAFT_509510 [Pleomassaria siparia CBS 279.74]|uniref:Uncharacterized protein n=1 Tax=Pleomassaria siparia CBS 279.74 TaxID=1314801 RepID=A0A6G1KNV3_9PLEO|nr:hypothetical protein K504DRAFT_509510 [Pleomassaria siparia CBS 279.74]
MCIYYRDMLSYGDTRKTRINYCPLAISNALKFPDDLPCHVPGDNSDALLRAMPSRHFQDMQDLRNARVKYDRAQQRLSNATIYAISAKRQEVCELFRQLLRFETQHIELGCRYYCHGAFESRDDLYCDQRHPYQLVHDVFHGAMPTIERPFFAVWADLERIIHLALQAADDFNLEPSERLERVTNKYADGVMLVHTIKVALQQLENEILSLEQIQPFYLNEHRECLTASRFNTHVWYWLRSLPETERILRAGKGKRVIIRDALNPDTMYLPPSGGRQRAAGAERRDGGTGSHDAIKGDQSDSYVTAVPRSRYTEQGMQVLLYDWTLD